MMSSFFMSSAEGILQYKPHFFFFGDRFLLLLAHEPSHELAPEAPVFLCLPAMSAYFHQALRWRAVHAQCKADAEMLYSLGELVL